MNALDVTAVVYATAALAESARSRRAFKRHVEHVDSKLAEYDRLHELRISPPDGGAPMEFPPDALWIGPNGDRYLLNGDHWERLP